MYGIFRKGAKMTTLRDMVFKHKYMVLCFAVGVSVCTCAFSVGGLLAFSLGFLIAFRIGDIE